MDRRRLALLPLLPCVAGLALAGCGGGDDDGGVPAGAVAKVGDTVVSKADYDRLQRFQLMRISRQVTNGKLFQSAQPKLLDVTPPFTACIRTATESVPAEAKAQITAAQIKQACENIPERLKTDAVQQLIATEVIKQEAEDDDVEVSDGDVDKALDAAYTQEIDGRKNLAKFKTLTGLDEGIFRQLVRQSLTYQKVTEKIASDAGPVTDDDVRKDFDDNRDQYGQPETRELHVVLAKDEADAKAARTALEGGATFASVAQQYSTDEQSRAQGGKLTQVQRAQLEKAAGDAAFSAGATELAGPVRTDLGWYVIRVDKITPGKAVSFDSVKTAIRQQLQQTKPQQAVAKWEADVLKRWKAKTDCAPGYNLVAFCKNQVTPKTGTTTGVAPATGD
ncbi:peptidyl-prolyl cis-trans isomerase [Patulibacter sp.]|uniref:peptidylprolyl isomerase n=1 Tax=Patulibacter sp. TaxID=1912859 RepID=UPI00271D7771|nr:peptidyl-prolyl cis-trans isomerase [Patulibacter sp.]MDO9409302.1 peptidyl-prolyl cis-trans isomerase [Patulibacter sp.]